jgi:hypothetical protein
MDLFLNLVYLKLLMRLYPPYWFWFYNKYQKLPAAGALCEAPTLPVKGT